MSNIGIVILAAGASSRMGRPKQLLPHGNGTLLNTAISAARGSQCAPIVLILGANAREILQRTATRNLIVAENKLWSEGIASSLRAGIETLKDADVEAAVIMTCDQPFVSAPVVDQLVYLYRGSGKAIVASQYADTLGIPALFDRSIFPELLKLSGDMGARAIIQRHLPETAILNFPEGVIDIDTADEYTAIVSAGSA
jgi:molybdenum cofactor cytidylyltransferase